MAADVDLIVVGTPATWRTAMVAWLGCGSRRPPVIASRARGSGRAAVPDTRRPVTILAAGDDVGAGDAWVDVLSSTFSSTVVRSPDIYHCAPDLLENTDLIVLSMPADSDTHFGAIVQVLKECVHPVLFVPSTDGIVERSPS